MVGQAIGAREEARIESERARKAEADARGEALQQRAMARESGEAHLIAVKEAEVTAREAELQRAARLELCEVSARLLKTGLGLLGIEVPARM